MVTDDYTVMLTYYCTVIYTMTMVHLGILPWILGVMKTNLFFLLYL